jgi:hypothetical protein
MKYGPYIMLYMDIMLYDSQVWQVNGGYDGFIIIAICYDFLFTYVGQILLSFIWLHG